MDELTSRLQQAQGDRHALDALIASYQPFLRQEALKAAGNGLEYDDRLSIAMLVFVQCVRQYQPERGAFIPFVSACIRNRLIDEGRKASRQTGSAVSLPLDDTHALSPSSAMAQYDRGLERRALAEEIDALDEELARHGLSLTQLEVVCPRQRRSREQCLHLARAVAEDPALYEGFRRTDRLPQAALAQRFGLSTKTIEKHRRYIVAVIVILAGDYPGVRSFLPLGGML